MYMMRVAEDRTLDVEGTPLTDEQRVVTLNNGWSSIAYLLDEPMPVREALADYYDKATIGDVIKSKDAVAVFSENGRWEGSLQTLRPGGGYLFRRQAAGDVTMRYIPSSSQSPERRRVKASDNLFTNPDASTNMTMVAKIAPIGPIRPITVYVNDELAGIATPQIVDGDTLYFLTIQSDKAGTLRFELDGEPLAPIVRSSVTPSIRYSENEHHGTVEEPVLLSPAEDQKPQKILDNGILYILMPDGTRFDATGKKLNN